MRTISKRRSSGGGKKAPRPCVPGSGPPNGSYQRLEIAWRGLSAVVEAGRDEDGELVILVTPEPASDAPFELVVSAGMAWNRPGSVESAPDGLVDGLPDRLLDGLVARLPDGEKAIRVAGESSRPTPTPAA